MAVYCSQGHENSDGSAFCDTCGEELTSAAPVAAAPADAGTQVCPKCGTVSSASETFCSNCGTLLGSAAAPVDSASSSVGSAPVVAAAPVAAAAPAVAAAPALTARLLVEADSQEFDLSGKDIVVIGREDAVSNIYPDVDLTPHGGEEGGVSRMHARIFIENGQYMLEDENSTNFTFLNRQKLTPKTPTALHDDDEIRLGRVLLRFKEA
ncbi:MAG TPA: FHA domain-containing protein [Ktedonobacteraceae bacterium]|nr:FHA domain-containing protein [Ktedonobacteraceae bacterium]